MATVFEIKRFAVHDGPGIRTTVFFKGCPLKCLWCHNPEGIAFQPQVAFYEQKCIGCGECLVEDFAPENCLGDARVLYGKEMTVAQVLAAVLEDRDFYETSGGGVTLSGGECLMQADFCRELLQALKAEGIHTAVDTCGFVSWESIDKVLPYTDLFLYDIKAFDEAVHMACTGQSNKRILENLAYLDAQGADIEVRIPYVPECNAHQMEKIAAFLAPFSHIRAVKVLGYHNYAGTKYAALGMENTLPLCLPTEAEVQAAQALFAK
ncbi:MAG: glycyl-radical enzyme activating protein [Oscillospiraceae bacterium]|nr:glycyl-radical enzyme activating protein [Oscillospiraceae bacterium]